MTTGTPGPAPRTTEVLEADPSAVLCATGVAVMDDDGEVFEEWRPEVDLLTPPPQVRFHRLIWTLGETHPLFAVMRSDALARTPQYRPFVGGDRVLLAQLILMGGFAGLRDLMHHYRQARMRPGARKDPNKPSQAEILDPANKGKLPSRTWRLCYEHLRLVATSGPGAGAEALAGRGRAGPLRGQGRAAAGRRGLPLGPDPGLPGRLQGGVGMTGGHVVVTGVAGFIGSHLAEALVERGHEVVGIDCFTPAYPPSEKRRNLEGLLGHPGFRLVEGDLVTLALDAWLEGASVVFHQAAQPGVRGSVGPRLRRLRPPQHPGHPVPAGGVRPHRGPAAGGRLVLQRLRRRAGLSDHRGVDHPAGLPYGVTKLASEHLCLAYARPGVADLSVATLRYFTVYGPRQRPDMAFRRFLDAAYAGRPIVVYGDGEQTRDFTHVDDAVRANLLAMTARSRPRRSTSAAAGGSPSTRSWT